MSYDPTNWKAGDTVTSAKLNKLEQGVAGAGILIIHENNERVLDKTWKEIHDAGFAVLFNEPDYYVIMVALYSEDGEYGVGFWTPEGTNTVYYVTDSENGYPVLSSNQNQL